MDTRPLRGLRLEIAALLSDGVPRTQYETATLLGRRSGDIHRALRQLVGDGVLTPSDTELRPGTTYRLPDDREALIEAELANVQLPGQLRAHQRLLKVDAPNIETFYVLMTDLGLSRLVSWVAERGDTKWWVALVPDLPKVESDRFKAALRRAGCECREQPVGAVMGATELRAQARRFMTTQRVPA